MTGRGTGDGTGGDVGSLAEEAVKLVEALQQWARDSGHEYGDVAAAAVDGTGDLLREVGEHLATGGAECTYCPLCRAIALVRATTPEVRAHLSDAASALLAAAVSALAHRAEARSAGRGPGTPLERIDLDAEPWEDD